MGLKEQMQKAKQEHSMTFDEFWAFLERTHNVHPVQKEVIRNIWHTIPKKVFIRDGLE